MDKRNNGERLEMPEGTVDWPVELLWDVLETGVKKEEKSDVGEVQEKDVDVRAAKEENRLVSTVVA